MAVDRLSIKDAAERLSVSPDTIRRRLKRGELTGRQEPTAQGFAWVIELPQEEAPETEVPPASSAAEPAAQGREETLELVELRERVAGLERRADELREERDEWREQAKRHEEASRELRILVQQAQALAQALPTTTGGDDRESAQGSQEAPQGGDRPGFWARLFGRSQGA